MCQRDGQTPEHFTIYFYDTTNVIDMPIGEAPAERKQITQVLPGKVDQESGEILELDTITRHLFILTDNVYPPIKCPDKIMSIAATPVGLDHCIRLLPTLDTPHDYKKGMTFVDTNFF